MHGFTPPRPIVLLALARVPPAAALDRPLATPVPAARPRLAGSAAVRLHCARPGALRLHRFEDGSARLQCGRRLLARVSVPG